jgi:thiamine-phosphate pyrophosphorylase
MLLYAITNRRLLAGSESERTSALIPLARRWASQNIDYIQIREKDLASNDLRELAQSIVSAVREINPTTKIILNGPADIALQSGADGVHLPANTQPSAAVEARALFSQSGREAILSHSCHSVEEVLKVREESQRDPHATTANTLILYAPVFEKVTADGKIPGQGIDALRAAVHAAGNISVLALGGITPDNTPECLAAGAAGIAGIRLFLTSDLISSRSS